MANFDVKFLLISWLIAQVQGMNQIVQNSYTSQTNVLNFFITSDNIGNLYHVSLVFCSSVCSLSKQCHSFNYNSEQAACVLFDECFICLNGYYESGWEYYCTEKSTVAFYATTTTTLAHQSNAVKFNSVYTNIGESYDKSTGVFTCKSDGLFVFSWTMEASTDKLESTLTRNGIVIGILVADPSGQDERDTSTNVVAVELSAGDKVEVYVHMGTAQELRSTFSGWEIPYSKNTSLFHASSTSNTAGNQLISFDDVLVNEGGSYSIASKSATVRTSGYYVYVFTIMSSTSTFNSIKMKINSIVKDTFDADGRWGDVDTTTMVTINEMSVDDEVSVQPSATVLAKQTTFTGFRIPVQCANFPNFAVKLSTTGTGKLVFDTVLVNGGNSYDPLNGEVTASIEGIYVITWRIRTSKTFGLEASGSLFVDGIEKSFGVTDATACPGNDCRDQTTGVAVLELSVGSKLYVEITSGKVSPGCSFVGFFLGRN